MASPAQIDANRANAAHSTGPRSAAGRRKASMNAMTHGLTAQTGRILYGRTPGIPLDGRGVTQAAELVDRFDGVRITVKRSEVRFLQDRCSFRSHA